MSKLWRRLTKQSLALWSTPVPRHPSKVHTTHEATRRAAGAAHGRNPGPYGRGRLLHGAGASPLHACHSMSLSFLPCSVLLRAPALAWVRSRECCPESGQALLIIFQSEQTLGLCCSARPSMAAEAVWCCARCSSLVLLSPCWFEGKAKFRCTLASTLSVIEKGGNSHRGNRSADNGP